jgi:CheY-like chemotaxis protein
VLNPAVLAAHALDQDRSVAWRPGGRPAPRRKKPRILFAEDSSITRSMILHILTNLGYQVSAVSDGKMAWELLREHGADLVLTDLDMPIMDGVELIARIRSSEAWRGLPVIVLSTRGNPADRQRAVDAGADDYLVKGELWETTLREALGRRLELPS